MLIEKVDFTPLEFIHEKTQDKNGRVKNILNRTFRK